MSLIQGILTMDEPNEKGLWERLIDLRIALGLIAERTDEPNTARYCRRILQEDWYGKIRSDP